MVNEQAPIPQRDWDGRYEVHSMFLTVQGEGPFSGQAAVFVRLEGCNLQCPFCDTDYTGGPRAQQLEAEEIAANVLTLIGESSTTLVVLTGGEPFRQDLTELVAALMEKKLRVQIETNGTMTPSDDFQQMFKDHFGIGIVVSPKAQYVHPWISQHAIAFKYVLSHDSIDPQDGLPLVVLGRGTKRVARPPVYIPQVFIQPADMHDDTEQTRLNHRAVVESAIKHGHIAQLQIHKHFGVE